MTRANDVRFVEEEAPNYLIYAQSSYEDRKKYDSS